MNHRIIYFLFLSLKLYPTYAQDSLVCKPSNSIVANQKMNVAYIGLDNPLLISYHNQKNFIITCDKGKIEKRDYFYYLTNLSEPGICHIKLTDLKGNNEVFFDFRVKNVPFPTATFSNQKTNSVINKNLLAAGCLILMQENFDYEVFYKTLSYKILITQANDSISSFTVQGNCLTAEIKNHFKRLQTNDTVLFYDIKGRLASSITAPDLDISPIKFTIK